MNKNNTLYNTAINFSLVLCMSVEPMACAESWRDFVNPKAAAALITRTLFVSKQKVSILMLINREMAVDSTAKVGGMIRTDQSNASTASGSLLSIN